MCEFCCLVYAYMTYTRCYMYDARPGITRCHLTLAAPRSVHLAVGSLTVWCSLYLSLVWNKISVAAELNGNLSQSNSTFIMFYRSIIFLRYQIKKKPFKVPYIINMWYHVQSASSNMLTLKLSLRRRLRRQVTVWILTWWCYCPTLNLTAHFYSYF